MKCIAHDRRQPFALLRQFKLADVSSEQFEPETLLEMLDLLADGALRKTQIRRCPREAKVPSRGLKCSQRRKGDLGEQGKH